MKIFAMSDIHGCPEAFDEALELVDLSGSNMLILCGDYIHGHDSYAVLDRIIELQQKYGSDKVVALMGNHEEMAMNGDWRIAEREDIEYDEEREERYISWMYDLPRYYATETQIFVHAGVCEDAGENWEWSTSDYEYTDSFDKNTGKFCMDIIAGHVYSSIMAGDPRFHDIYFDGESHYYIDGDVLTSGVIPVLMYDTETKRYYQMSEGGAWTIEPYSEEY